MAVTVGTLLVELRAKTDAFTKGMGDAKTLAFDSSAAIVDSIGKIGTKLTTLNFTNMEKGFKSIATIGGLAAGASVGIAAAMFAAAESTAKNAKEMSKLSQSFGLSIETVSGLRVAAKLTGVELDVLTRGFGKLAKSSAAAADEGKTSLAGFLKITDGAGKLRSMNDLVIDVAARFAKLEDGTGKTALAMQLFGKAGAALIPFLNRGKEGVKELMDLSERLGLTWSDKDVASAEQFTRAMEIQELKVLALKEQMSKALMPALDGLSNAFLNVDTNGNSLAKNLGSSLGATLTAIAKIAIATANGIQLIGMYSQEVYYALTFQDEKFRAIENMRILLLEREKKTWEDLDKLQSNASGGGGHSGGKGTPTFGGEAATSAAQKALETLDQLAEKTRTLVNKAEGNSLSTEIDNITNQLKKLAEFEQKHPERVWMSAREQVSKLYDALKLIENEQKAIILGAVLASGAENIKSIWSIPPPTIPASGQAQISNELGKSLSSTEGLNRWRLESAQISNTLNPLRAYQAEMARISELDKQEKLDGTAKWAMQTEALDRYNRSMDELDMKTKKGSAGARVFFRQYIEDSRNMATQVYQAMQKVTFGMENAFSNFFHDTLMGTKTLGKAFADLGVAILDSVVSAISQMIAKMLIAFIMAKVFGLDPDKQKKKQKQDNMELALSAAALAGANTLALTSAMYPPPAPEILAGLAYGTGAGFAALASAAGGMDVDRDQIMKVHEKEVVMPRVLSDGFRRIINTFNPSTPSAMPALAGGGVMGGHTFQFNVHGGNSDEVAEKVMGKVKQYFRTGGVMR